MRRSFLLHTVVAVCLLLPVAAQAGDVWQDMDLSKGQRVFVPMAHNIADVPAYNLTRYLWSAAIIRNVDLARSITVTRIVAVSPDGKIENFPESFGLTSCPVQDGAS